MPPLSFTIGIDARALSSPGTGPYTRHLVRALAEVDDENRYRLLVGPDDQGEFDDLPERFETLTERAPVHSWRESATLSWRLWRRGIDVYHATHYSLPASLPCKTVVTVHDIVHLLYPEFMRSGWAFFNAQRRIRRALGRADRIITNSQNTRTDLIEHYRVDSRKIRRIYPGVPERAGLGERQVGDVLASYGIERPFLLFVGAPMRRKNLDNTVKAFARALESSSIDASLVCLDGRENTGFKMRQRAEQLGISDKVRLLDAVDDADMPVLYESAELFLYPTLYDGFGVPVIEAMAAGTAVVASTTSTLREIAEGYAQLVDPLDVSALAAAITRCLGDAAHRQRLEREGRRRAEVFSWHSTALETLEVYRSALGLPPAASPSEAGTTPLAAAR